MGDAITNLGGGGLSSPWLANLSNCLNYLCSFILTLFGGPLINKIGIKWSCLIAAVAMPFYGSAFYVNARHGVDWYLVFGNVRLVACCPGKCCSDLGRSSKASPLGFSTSAKLQQCCLIRTQRIEVFILVCAAGFGVKG